MKKILNKITFLALIILLIVVFSYIIYYFTKNTFNNNKNLSSKDSNTINKNVQILAALEDKNIPSIESKINSIQDKFSASNSNSNYKDIFSSTVIMGDSQTEGLLVYDFLNSTSVIAKKGSNIIDAKSNLDTLSNLAPSNIILLYGMNDILIYQNDINKFIKDYTNLINLIKKSNPNSKIFVNCVLPVENKVSINNTIFNIIPKYNLAIEKMCTNLNINFINTTNLLLDNPSFYEEDGMHLKPIFYDQWLSILKKYI